MPSAFKASQPLMKGNSKSVGSSNMRRSGATLDNAAAHARCPGCIGANGRTARDQVVVQGERLGFRVVRTPLEVIVKAERPPVLQRVAMEHLDVTVIDALDASSPWQAVTACTHEAGKGCGVGEHEKKC